MATPAISIDNNNVQPLRVLVVDDDCSNRSMLTDTLRYEGYRVTAADDGETAFACWQREEFDVILMDVQLPGLNGLDITQKIRVIERTNGKHPPIRIIAVTGATTSDDRKRCFAAGMDAFLVKPIHFDALFQTLHRFFPNRAPPVSTTAPPCESIHDLPIFSEHLPQAWKHDAVKQQQYIDVLVTGIRHNLLRIEMAVRENEAETMSRMAHTLKGALGHFRSERLMELILRIEKLGKQGSTRGASGILAQLENEFAGVIEDFRSGRKP